MFPRVSCLYFPSKRHDRRNPQNRRNPDSFVELRRCLTQSGFEGYELCYVAACITIITGGASICG